jgi:hypothetical protein
VAKFKDFWRSIRDARTTPATRDPQTWANTVGRFADLRASIMESSGSTARGLRV